MGGVYKVLFTAHELDWTAIQYDTRCYFNVHSKADMSHLNLLHRTNN